MQEVQRIVGYLKTFVQPGQITELRAFGSETYSGTFSYDSLETMAVCAMELERKCSGVYFVPNPISIAATNEIKVGGNCASDSDVIERRWCLIDVDPVRPDGLSATDEERQAAWKVLCHVQTSMEASGFSDPIIACSGNGWHISFPISLPNDEETRLKMKALLQGLHKRCSTPSAKVDVKTYNASRIWKLYGTKAKKGVATEQRPHRVAWVSKSSETLDDSIRKSNSNSLISILSAWEGQESALAQLETQRQQTPVSGEISRRAAQYISKISPAVSGQGGHDKTFHVAMVLVEGFGLSAEEALPVMNDWNRSCVPPWPSSDIVYKLKEASKLAARRGYLLESAQAPTATRSSRSVETRQAYTGPDCVAAQEISEDDPDATAGDLIRQQTTVSWIWPGWIQKGTITAIASDPGIGKTRLCADLLRRVNLGLPWPDGQPATLPIGSVAIWLAADSQWAELASLPGEMNFPPEAIVLNGRRSNPYSGTNLDSMEDLAEFERRIKRVKPGLIFVDTCGSATDRNTTRPEEAKGFFKPLAEIATRCGVSIVLVTHLNKGGEALGRRIVGACRQVIKLEQPDPEGSPNRRKLWVDKTNSKKPEALGVTMKDEGNDYDNSPPQTISRGSDEPGRPAALRGRPSNLVPDSAWLTEYLSTGAKRVKDCIDDAEDSGISMDRLYRAKKNITVEEYQVDNRKWWKIGGSADA